MSSVLQRICKISRRITPFPGGTIWVTMVLVALATPVGAQGAQQAQQRAYKHNLSREDSIAIAAASAKADTGRMKPGLRDLTAYDTPGYCLAMIRTILRNTWRAHERDTMKYGPTDTLPTEVYEKGKQCVANMRPADVHEAELYNLLELSAILRDTVRMREVVTYYISLPHISARNKFWFIADAAAYAGSVSRPVNTAFTVSMLEMLKPRGLESLEQTLAVYRILKDDIHQKFDTAGLVKYIAEIHTYLSSFPEEELKKRNIDPVRECYRDSLDLIWYKRGTDYAQNIMRLTYAATEDDPSPFAALERTLSELYPSKIGTPPPEMELVQIFPNTASATPEKGKVTIYYRVLYVGSGTHLNAMLGKLRRLYERYHSQGLEVVLVSSVRGYMWYSPPLEPEQEAPLHAWYFREYHNLPFTVAVNKIETQKKPDGRIVRMKPKWDDFFGGARVNGFLVGKDGTIQAIDQIIHSEEEAAAYIERELKK